MSPMDTSDKWPTESWGEYFGRKHDMAHGRTCGCAWNQMSRMSMPLPGHEFDTTEPGKRVVTT